ncbi:alpha/beta fold hydrolase [Reinekea sp. G2M2-21]|uniref:alpha/beta fold hydrolase n=1 Tax=Reinekea sp. G2M2-21 TaxID=2788942 RepID=UPI0018AC746D|nr:alpha/beta hydrolase [Reinekea sp. G2M2-21]
MMRGWLPGWQFSAAPLQPLQNRLQDSAVQDMALHYADTPLNCEQWLDAQSDKITGPCELIGWSLGGMLALALAQRNPLITRLNLLHCNVRFAGGPGLSESVAEQFRQRYQRNPDITRRRFAALVDSQQPDDLFPLMLSGDQSSTLGWLYELDFTDKPLPCPTRVLLAQDDFLVPADSAQKAWLALGADVRLTEGEHSLLWRDPQQVADWIADRG